MSSKGSSTFDLRIDTPYNLTTYIDVYGDQGKGTKHEDDDTQNLDIDAIQCGAFHHHYQDLYACATTGNIFLINMATGTMLRSYSLQNIGVVKQLIFVSPIRRVVRRVTKKGDDNTIFDQPYFYNPCIRDLYIAFIVHYPANQSTTLYLLDLASPVPELYRYHQSNVILSISAPVTGIQMNVTTATTANEVESKPFGEQYSAVENGKAPYMAIALSTKDRVTILSILAPANLTPDTKRSPIEFHSLHISSPLMQLSTSTFVGFGSKPWHLFVCKGPSVLLYNLELSRTEGNRDATLSSSLKWVEEQRANLFQALKSRRATLDSYFLDNFVAFTAVSESMKQSFNSCKLLYYWSFEQCIVQVEQTLMKQDNAVALERHRLLGGHPLEIKAIAVAHAGDCIALATEAFVLLFSVAAQKLLAVLTYPDPETDFVHITLNFMSGTDHDSGPVSGNGQDDEAAEGSNAADDVANLDDFDIFADEGAEAESTGETPIVSPSNEPQLKKPSGEAAAATPPLANTLNPLTRDAIQRLMSMPCIVDTTVLSDISTSSAGKTNKNVISADLVSQDPYLYFMNKSIVEVRRSETVAQRYKLVDFIYRHKHMYPIVLDLYTKHVDLNKQLRMDSILSKQLGASSSKSANSATDAPAITCKSVAFKPQLHVDLSIRQSFEFICNGTRLVLASMCGFGRPVYWNLTGLDMFAEKYKSRENSTIILPGFFWNLAVLEEKDLRSANTCQFNPVSGFMIKNVGPQLRIYMPK